MPTADTIRRVRARALLDGPEGETARAILAELEKKYPDLANEPEEQEGQLWLATRDWHRNQLITYVGCYLGCRAFNVKHESGVLLKGPTRMLAAVDSIVEALWKKLREIHKGATLGFLGGALPPDASIMESIRPDPEKPKEKLSSVAAAAMAATWNIGQDASPRRLLSASTRTS